MPSPLQATRFPATGRSYDQPGLTSKARRDSLDSDCGVGSFFAGGRLEVTTILVAVEVAFYREGLGGLLAAESGVELVGALADADDALRVARERRPDVVLLGLPMDAGVSLAARLGEIIPAPRVVPLVIEELEDDVLAWADVGIAGYVTRKTSFRQLVAMLTSVAEDEAIVSPRMTSALLRHVAALAAAQPASPIAARLTHRELEVAELLERGLSNKQIALQLHVETNTVKNHVHSILDKLAVSRRGEVGQRMRSARAATPTRMN